MNMRPADCLGNFCECRCNQQFPEFGLTMRGQTEDLGSDCRKTGCNESNWISLNRTVPQAWDRPRTILPHKCHEGQLSSCQVMFFTNSSLEKTIAYILFTLLKLWIWSKAKRLAVILEDEKGLSKAMREYQYYYFVPKSLSKNCCKDASLYCNQHVGSTSNLINATQSVTPVDNYGMIGPSS